MVSNQVRPCKSCEATGKIRGRLGLLLVIIHEYQMTYYANVNNEKNCIRLRMFAIVV